MLSKRKLAVVLPMLFELAMGYDYYYGMDLIGTENRPTNRWGNEGPSDSEHIVKVGNIGGGYYGRMVSGLRDYEKGDLKVGSKERLFGSSSTSYPYSLEEERILNKNSLASLTPEARLRMMVEPFREKIYNATGQLPSAKEMRKLKPQFKSYVQKELNLTSSEMESLFGTPTTKGKDGVLPKYLLFDDMDKYDFDPEEALRFMPRVSKKATKEELDAAYIKAWEMLGKNDDRLKKVYKAYRRKYLEKNPLGPVMTEKEFLLYSIKLREKEAVRLGFRPSAPHLDPITKNVEISYFLREALKDEYEKYKSQNPEDKVSSATKFRYEALFGDKLILDEMEDASESGSQETLPSPYDPIEGRAWTNTTASSSIISITDAHDKISNREAVYDTNGNVVVVPKGANTDSDSGELLRENEESDEVLGGSVGFHKLSKIKKNINVKSPSQVLFERSQYSTSAQKRVIDRLEDFTLVSINDMSVNQMSLFHSLVFNNFYTEAEKKEEENYFKQRTGEHGGDTGTNTEVYREFLFNKFGNGLFFIPKEINLNRPSLSNTVLPVSATGFEVVENKDGVAKIRHIASDLSFNVDYSGSKSFYLNGYLGMISHDNLPSPNVKTFVSTGWKVADSQVPSPYRLISSIDNKVNKLSSLDSSFYLIKENLLESGTEKGATTAAKISTYLARSSGLLKKYEESRNSYIRSQEKLLDELNKCKSVFRSGAVLESLNKVSDSLSGETSGVDVSKLMEGLSKNKLEAFIKQRDELTDITEKGYTEHIAQLNKASKECLRNYFVLVNSCNDLITESGRINNAIADLGDDLAEKIYPSIDEKQNLAAEVQNDITKLHYLNGYLNNNADMLLSLNINNIGINRLVESPEISKELSKEVTSIFNGMMSVSEYKKLIENNRLVSRYSIEEPVDSTEGLDEEENEVKEKKTKETTPKYSTDLKGKARRVFDESMTIIEEHIRDVYIKFGKREERLMEILSLEAFLIRELSRHRDSLSIVLNRMALPEDEIIDESETDELKIRILLKILEEKTKLLYVRDVLNKLFFYPHFPGLRPSFSKRLRDIEEEGIMSRFGFTYLPKFRYSDEKQPIGIYGFSKIDYFDLKDSYFERLTSGFEYDVLSYTFELEMANALENLGCPELNHMITSDDYTESSIFTKKTKLFKMLKKLIKTETDKEKRRRLKLLYFELKDWLYTVVKYELSQYGVSPLANILNMPFDAKENEPAQVKGSESVVLSSETKSSVPSRSVKRKCRVRRGN